VTLQGVNGAGTGGHDSDDSWVEADSDESDAEGAVAGKVSPHQRCDRFCAPPSRMLFGDTTQHDTQPVLDDIVAHDALQGMMHYRACRK